jgi:hypothetical protein
MTTQSKSTRARANTPIVCTISVDDGREQLLEWADLQTRASEVVAINSGARLTLPASMFDQVQDLMKREALCCTFLNFDITVQEEDMTFEVTAPNPDALPVISALAGIPIQ